MIFGQCLCGRVSFSTNAASIWCAHCHCRMCQFAHGAAFVTWIGLAADAVEIRDDELQWYQSSAEAERGFCRQCGTSLFFRSSKWPGELHVARALIEGDIDREPGGHSFYDSHVTWVSTDDDLPVS